MAIKKIEDFKSTLELVHHNCAMAIRAYCCASSLFNNHEIIAADNVVLELQWFTVQSGLLSLCRVWDPDARSLKDLIHILESEFVREEMDRQGIFEEFFCVVTRLEYETTAVLSSRELKKVRKFRNTFLAHSTGADPNCNNPMFGRDFETLLERTIPIIDQLRHALGEEKNALRKLFVTRLDECSYQWNQIRSVGYKPRYYR